MQSPVSQNKVVFEKKCPKCGKTIEVSKENVKEIAVEVKDGYFLYFTFLTCGECKSTYCVQIDDDATKSTQKKCVDVVREMMYCMVSDKKNAKRLYAKYKKLNEKNIEARQMLEANLIGSSIVDKNGKVVIDKFEIFNE